MTVEKFAISFERELARLVRKSAANEPTSAWLADAARRKLRAEGLLEVVSDWEHLHGDVTVAELQHEENRQRSALADRRTAARGATFDSATKKATNATNTANAAKATKATKAAKATNATNTANAAMATKATKAAKATKATNATKATAVGKDRRRP